MHRYGRLLGEENEKVRGFIREGLVENFFDRTSSIKNLQSIFIEIDTKEQLKKRVDLEDVNLENLRVYIGQDSRIVFKKVFPNMSETLVKTTATAQSEFLEMLTLKPTFKRLQREGKNDLSLEIIKMLKETYDKGYTFRMFQDEEGNYNVRAILGTNTKIYDNKFAIFRLLTQLEMDSIYNGSKWGITDFEYSLDETTLQIDEQEWSDLVLENGEEVSMKCGLLLKNNEVGKGALSLEFRYEVKLDGSIISGISEKVFRFTHTSRYDTVEQEFTLANIKARFEAKKNAIIDFIVAMTQIDEIHTPILLSDLVETLLKDNHLNGEEELRNKLKDYKKSLYKKADFDLFKDIASFLDISVKSPLNKKVAFEYSIYKTFNKILDIQNEEADSE